MRFKVYGVIAGGTSLGCYYWWHTSQGNRTKLAMQTDRALSCPLLRKTCLAENMAILRFGLHSPLQLVVSVMRLLLHVITAV